MSNTVKCKLKERSTFEDKSCSLLKAYVLWTVLCTVRVDPNLVVVNLRENFTAPVILY